MKTIGCSNKSRLEIWNFRTWKSSYENVVEFLFFARKFPLRSNFEAKKKWKKKNAKKDGKSERNKLITLQFTWFIIPFCCCVSLHVLAFYLISPLQHKQRKKNYPKLYTLFFESLSKFISKISPKKIQRKKNANFSSPKKKEKKNR